MEIILSVVCADVDVLTQQIQHMNQTITNLETKVERNYFFPENVKLTIFFTTLGIIIYFTTSGFVIFTINVVNMAHALFMVHPFFQLFHGTFSVITSALFAANTYVGDRLSPCVTFFFNSFRSSAPEGVILLLNFTYKHTKSVRK